MEVSMKKDSLQKMHRSSTLSTYHEHDHSLDGDVDHVTEWLGVINGLKKKNEPNNNGHLAIQLKGCNSINEYIIKGFKKCHPTAKYEYIYRLVQHECVDAILDILEDSMSDPNKIKNHVGYTLFHLAAENNMMDIVTCLINVDTNLHVKTNKGATPLHLAVRKNNTDCVKLLLKHGANAIQKDNYGYTPVDYAKAVEVGECLEILNKHIEDHSLEKVGLFRNLSVEETKVKRQQTLKKQNSIVVAKAQNWFDY